MTILRLFTIAAANSNVEKHRLTLALQDDVETIDRLAVLRFARGYKRLSAAFEFD